MMQITKKILTIGLCSLGTTPAFADDEHYVNFLLGGRAMGMGGAYTAVSDDPAGMYYNPAGIVYAHSPNLSASVNAFRYSSKTFKDVLKGGNDWGRESSALVPNFFGVTQPFGKFTVGFSYAVPDISEEDQAQKFTNLGSNIDSYTVNLNDTNTVNKFGPSIAYQASDSLSIGVTIYAHTRSTRTILNQHVFFDDNGTQSSEWSNSYRKNNEYGVMPKLGVIWSPTDKLALAATYSQNFVIYSEGYSQSTCFVSSELTASSCKKDDNIQSYALHSAAETRNTHSEDPFELRFGAAYFASNQLLLSSDLTYHSEVTGKRAVVNVAGGAEYYVDPEWAIRAGAFTNISNALTPTKSYASEQINYYGGALSLTRFSKNSSISLGTNIQYGIGTTSSLAKDSNNDNIIVDTNALDMTFFLSTAYSY